MPELEIQRRQNQGVPAWAWLIGALLLVGLIWWLIAASTNDRRAAAPAPDQQVAGSRETLPATTPTAETGTAAGTDATAGLTSAEWLPLAAMRANPDNYFGQPVSGLGTVAEVVSDRAFWIEQRGDRVFVLKSDDLMTAPALAVGNRVSIGGTVHNPDRMQEVPGTMQLDQPTQKLLQGEPAFIRATSIEVQNS